MPIADATAVKLQELLDAALVALAQTRTGNPVPARVYRSHNAPAVDFCDGGLLVTYLDTPAEALSRVRVNKTANTGQAKMVPVLQMVVELWRCVPNLDNNGTAPSEAALDAAYAALAVDEHALTTGLVLAKSDGTLFPTSAMGCAVAELGDPIPLGPQGSAAGWRMRVNVPISDTGPAI